MPTDCRGALRVSGLLCLLVRLQAEASRKMFEILTAPVVAADVPEN